MVKSKKAFFVGLRAIGTFRGLKRKRTLAFLGKWFYVETHDRASAPLKRSIRRIDGALSFALKRITSKIPSR